MISTMSRGKIWDLNSPGYKIAQKKVCKFYVQSILLNKRSSTVPRTRNSKVESKSSSLNTMGHYRRLRKISMRFLWLIVGIVL